VTVIERSVAKLHRFAATLAVAILVLAAAGSAHATGSRYAAIVIDDASGKVLHQVNADAQRYPASLTKMMTLYLTFEALEAKKLTLDQRMTVSARAAGMAPSRLGLRAGESLTVRQAILGLVTKSANDAAAVLGETIGGGSEADFAVLMTKRAHALGMTNTTFKNASGLPNPKQVTTARDMVTLARAIRHDYPQYYTYFKTPEFTFKGITHKNHNRLLAGFEGTDGLKTGFINASGFNLVASSVRDGRRLFGVVLGGDSAGWRDARMMSLFDQAYNRSLQPGDTMVADAMPRKPGPSKAKAQAQATKPKTAPRTALIASAEAAPSAEQGDAASTSLAALPPNRARAATKPGQGWAIQVGAFSTHGPAQDAANKAKNKLPKTLKGASVAVSTGADSLYRSRLIGLSEKQAQSACKQLIDRGTACITIAPDQGGPNAG
jgi:D-alanyl-D-alanine carboxypeptidase